MLDIEIILCLCTCAASRSKAKNLVIALAMSKFFTKADAKTINLYRCFGVILV